LSLPTLGLIAPREKMTAHPSHMVQDLVRLAEVRAAERGDDVACTYLADGERPSKRLSYAELDRRARCVATFLQARAAQGTRALLVFPNRLDFLTAFFGCLYAGLIAVPVPPPRTAQAFARLRHVVGAAGAELVLASDTLRTALERRASTAESLKEPHWIFCDEIADGLERDWRRPRIAPDDIAVLQFTSGSTGNPKGVSVSHANILHNCALLRAVCGSSPDMKLVAWLPNFHDWGLVGCLMFPLFVGRPSFTFDPADFLYRPRRWLEAIGRLGATITCAPNFAYEMCHRSIGESERAGLDLSTLQMAMIGAEPIRKHTIEAFSSAFAKCGFRKEVFFPCFGLAESTLIVSGGTRMTAPVYARIDRAALEHRRVVMVDASAEGSDFVGCGRPVLDQRVMVVDAETRQPCTTTEIGEIWVAGPSVAKGYWDEPQLSEDVFGASPACAPDEGWLRTGDLGFISNGELFICGRLKDVIIKAGVNYLAEDIEQTVGSSHIWLRPNGCAVFSVEAEGAERLVIVQELDFGRRGDTSAVIGAIQSAVVKEHHVMADAIAVIRPGSLEKTGSGKVRRQLTKSLFLNGTLPITKLWKCW
jgi:acyl-CoA synthetase (AMP-forming)/AMP-acid ligase II